MSQFILTSILLLFQNGEEVGFDLLYDQERVEQELISYSSARNWPAFLKKIKKVVSEYEGKICVVDSKYVSFNVWLRNLLSHMGAETISIFQREFAPDYKVEFGKALSSADISRCLSLIDRFFVCKETPDFVLKLTNQLVEKGQLTTALLVFEGLIGRYDLEIKTRELVQARINDLKKHVRWDFSYPRAQFPVFTNMGLSDEPSSRYCSIDEIAAGIENYKKQSLCLMEKTASVKLDLSYKRSEDVFVVPAIDPVSDKMLVNNGFNFKLVDLKRLDPTASPGAEPHVLLSVSNNADQHANQPSLASSQFKMLPSVMSGLLVRNYLIVNQVVSFNINNIYTASQHLVCYELSQDDNSVVAKKLWSLKETGSEDLKTFLVSFIPPFVNSGDSLVSVVMKRRINKYGGVQSCELYIYCFDIKNGAVLWKRQLDSYPLYFYGQRAKISYPYIFVTDGLINVVLPHSFTVYRFTFSGELVGFDTFFKKRTSANDFPQQGFTYGQQSQVFIMPRWFLAEGKFFFADDNDIYKTDFVGFNPVVQMRISDVKALIAVDRKKVSFVDKSGHLAFFSVTDSAPEVFSDPVTKINEPFCATDRHVYFVEKREGKNDLISINLDNLMICCSTSFEGAELHSPTYYKDFVIASSIEGAQIFRSLEIELELARKNSAGGEADITRLLTLLNRVFERACIRNVNDLYLRTLPNEFADNFSRLKQPEQKEFAAFPRFIVSAISEKKISFNAKVLKLALKLSSDTREQIKITNELIGHYSDRSRFSCAFYRFYKICVEVGAQDFKTAWKDTAELVKFLRTQNRRVK
ncbi:MAG: hypothetical protein HY606_01270 [Planctomycetes bacterium]|nr:hypothetical protein [Planctomycetota bacterium]